MGTTVFRVEKNREFVVMNNKFLREKGMSLKAKGLLALCLSLPEDWNYSLNGLCAICKESQTSIRSALKELETFNYLKRERNKDSKGQFVYEYILYEVPYSGFVHTENQNTQNVHTEEAYTENRIQQSTNKQNTNNKDINRENIEKDIESVLQNEVNNEELIELYRDYIEMRKGMDAPLTTKALSMLISRCKRLSKNNIKVQKLLLENAIVNGWKNVYLPSDSELNATNKETIEDFKNYLGLE